MSRSSSAISLSVNPSSFLERRPIFVEFTWVLGPVACPSYLSWQYKISKVFCLSDHRINQEEKKLSMYNLSPKLSSFPSQVCHCGTCSWLELCYVLLVLYQVHFQVYSVELYRLYIFLLKCLFLCQFVWKLHFQVYSVELYRLYIFLLKCLFLCQFVWKLPFLWRGKWTHLLPVVSNGCRIFKTSCLECKIGFAFSIVCQNFHPSYQLSVLWSVRMKEASICLISATEGRVERVHSSHRL